MTDHRDIWISVAEALQGVTQWLAEEAKLDAPQARDEAKEAIIGALASGRLRSCPHGYLTSTLADQNADKRRATDYRFDLIGCDGRYSKIEIDFDRDSGHPIVPFEFWRMFRDPSAGPSAMWQEGDFSFNVTTRSGEEFSGEVSSLCVDPAGLPGRAHIPVLKALTPSACAPIIEKDNAAAPSATAGLNEGSPLQRRRRGRPTAAKEHYIALHKSRFERGEAFSVKTDEAEFLLKAVSSEIANNRVPKDRTIVNWLVKYGYGKWHHKKH